MGIEKREFGVLQDGSPASLYLLRNSEGIEVGISDFGATIVSLRTADQRGQFADIVLGYDSVEGYIADKAFFGCTVGRVANRIREAGFELDGTFYRLDANMGDTHLHGGKVGFSKRMWHVEIFGDDRMPRLRMSLMSEDGDQHYPGNLLAAVTFTLGEDNTLTMDYKATTDHPTPINLTNHSYFNLTGNAQKDILNHVLRIPAKYYTQLNEALVPTGKLIEVEGTAYDFRSPRAIGEQIDNTDDGYDINYCLRTPAPEGYTLDNEGDDPQPAAEVSDPDSGRHMEVWTTQPGVQLYTGNFLDAGILGKEQTPCDRHSGFCLETQHWPDAVHHESFPSIILRPNEKYTQKTILKFSTM